MLPEFLALSVWILENFLISKELRKSTQQLTELSIPYMTIMPEIIFIICLADLL
jgi:hypothetical protein